MTELQAKQEQLRSGALHPMELKKQLAFILTAQMHDEESALRAQAVFEQVVQRRELPTEMNELLLAQDSMSALDVVMSTNVVPSRSEARRLIEQGGVELAGQSVRDPWAEVSIVDGDVLRVGKRQFFRIKR